MPLKDAFIAELKHEAVNTRKMLEKLPEDKFDWKPHDKSMTLGRLASHIAELPVWVNRALAGDEFNFATTPVSRATYENVATLLKIFEEKQAGAIAALQNAPDEILEGKFKLLRGEQLMFELPRKIMLRSLTLNHIVHHRGQLSVFLRLLDVPVPGMYGPSADDR